MDTGVSNSENPTIDRIFISWTISDRGPQIYAWYVHANGFWYRLRTDRAQLRLPDLSGAGGIASGACGPISDGGEHALHLHFPALPQQLARDDDFIELARESSTCAGKAFIKGAA